jgi:hypothetical protein
LRSFAAVGVVALERDLSLANGHENMATVVFSCTGIDTMLAPSFSGRTNFLKARKTLQISR